MFWKLNRRNVIKHTEISLNPKLDKREGVAENKWTFVKPDVYNIDRFHGKIREGKRGITRLSQQRLIIPAGNCSKTNTNV